MMAKVVMPKKIAINFNFIALLNMIASGKLNAATAIMNANAVPRGKPF
jgi:hypothetical protein